MVEVLAGIYEKETDAISAKVDCVPPSEGDGPTWVQIDIADNTLVPNTAGTDIPGLARIIADHPGLSFEAHLMVASPEKYVKSLVDAGFKRIVAHVECNDPRLFISEAAYESVEIGLALDGPTEIEQIEPFMDELDFVLVMTIEAGASGQSMLPETVEKIKSLRDHYPDFPIEVDGGVNDQTAKIVGDAGATRLVSTSYMFSDTAHVADRLRTLRAAG